MPHDLSVERILAATPVRTCEHHAEIASTQDRARQLAAAAETELPALVLADRQTAGRGRGKHRWWTGAGSLALSYVVEAGEYGIRPGHSPRLSLAVASAIVYAVRPYLPGQIVGLHWPNDVFVAERKLAGALVEHSATGRLIVGIGLNANNRLADAPPELAPKLATLADLSGGPCDRTELLLALLASLETQLRKISSDKFNDAPDASLDELCLQRDCQLTIRSGGHRLQGACLGITSAGALRLLTSAGEVTLLHGTIEH